MTTRKFVCRPINMATKLAIDLIERGEKSGRLRTIKEVKPCGSGDKLIIYSSTPLKISTFSNFMKRLGIEIEVEVEGCSNSCSKVVVSSNENNTDLLKEQIRTKYKEKVERDKLLIEIHHMFRSIWDLHEEDLYRLFKIDDYSIFCSLCLAGLSDQNRFGQEQYLRLESVLSEMRAEEQVLKVKIELLKQKHCDQLAMLDSLKSIASTVVTKITGKRVKVDPIEQLNRAVDGLVLAAEPYESLHSALLSLRLSFLGKCISSEDVKLACEVRRLLSVIRLIKSCLSLKDRLAFMITDSLVEKFVSDLSVRL